MIIARYLASGWRPDRSEIIERIKQTKAFFITGDYFVCHRTDNNLSGLQSRRMNCDYSVAT